ncbi:hypothetical protein TCDM_07501 [Trypanosoma cruzi Dm28c]|uniref:Mucin TcMUCII n=1 Tax=Trypanosoma cruzi Dm28c TaxID=1416333 RepID=V5BEG5_TRYCR|nr:hypothetical protein TCDM_07501 [Trypanosoma cruzi Dm28c]
MVYCKDWPEGTHDENATSTAIHFRRHGSNAARANTPCGFSGVTCTVLFAVIFPPSPSVGADVPVDATSCGFRTHPLIDAADTAAHCWCFLHDRCTAPSSWWNGTGDENTADQVQSDGAGSPVSVPLITPPASKEIDGTGKALTECQDTSCFSSSLLVKQPDELTTTLLTNDDKGTTTTADSDSPNAVFHTTSHLLHLIVSYACCCCCFDSGYVCMKWCPLNMHEGQRQLNCFCDEYWLHFPWTNNPRDVRGSLLFLNCYFAFVLLCALHLLLCVCVPSVRGAGTTDRSRRVCMRWSLVCRSCLLLPPPSLCVCVRACCRGLECVLCLLCGVRCMAGCCPLLVWCALCVCLPHLSSLCCSPFPSLCRSAPHH